MASASGIAMSEEVEGPGAPDSRGGQQERRVMLLVRVPEHVRVAAREAASHEGLTLTAWVEALISERIDRSTEARSNRRR
jgi:hypothetical protein